MRMGHLMKAKQVYGELKYREYYNKLEYENELMRKLLIEAKYDLIDWVTAYGDNGCSGEIINDINCFLEGEKYETDKKQ